MGQIINFEQAKEYVQQIQTGEKIKPGLDTTRRLLELLKHPEDRLRFIHIAGTNGKGSTATFISNILAKAGYKVGRYVSPAVFDDREKIHWISGDDIAYITEEEFVTQIKKIRVAIEEMVENGETIPTEFEIETALAFLSFVDWQCDIVVLETGMGGRLDATNVIQNVVCSVITPVAMDHMQFLGNTIEEIAREKAGIIKEGVPVVLCQNDLSARECILSVCREKRSDVAEVNQGEIVIHEMSQDQTIFSYEKYQNLHLSLMGEFQVENACLALLCISQIQRCYPVSQSAMKEGLKNAKWPGRFEKIGDNPVTVADGAHNPAAMIRFCDSVRRYFGQNQRIGIMGVFADKDYRQMAQILKGVFDRIYTITPAGSRGLPAKYLCEVLVDAGIDAIACDTMEEAVYKARGTNDQQVVFVFGSLSVLQEIYSLLY